MPLKKFISVLLCLLAVVLDGKDVLRNRDFKQLKADGTPSEWELRGGAQAFKCVSGAAVLTYKTGAPVMLIQNRIKLTPGKEYVFLADVKAPRGTDYTIYFEENIKGK